MGDKSRELLTFEQVALPSSAKDPDCHMDSIQQISVERLQYIQHCVRLQGHVMNQA